MMFLILFLNNLKIKKRKKFLEIFSFPPGFQFNLRRPVFHEPPSAKESESQIAAAAETGADRVEFYTGPYGATHDDPAAAQSALADLARTAGYAAAAGLEMNAGHDLTVANLAPLIATVPDIAEVSIGHGLTADALISGMDATVRRFLGACRPT